MYGPWVLRFIIYTHIGPVAQTEDKDPPEEEGPTSEETVLKDRKVGFGHNSFRECVEDEKVLGRTKPRS